MDAIEDFQVEVDLSEQSVLYDYATCQFITRPPSTKRGWAAVDWTQYGSTAHIPKEQKKYKFQIELIDSAFQFKRFFEKKVDNGGKANDNYKVQGESDMVIFGDFNNTDVNSANKVDGRLLPSRVLPMYKPGQLVKGTVVLKLRQAVEGNSLSIQLHGAAHTNFRTYNQYGYYDHSGEENFVKEDIILWQSTDNVKNAEVGGAGCNNIDVSDYFTLVCSNNDAEPLRSKVLPAGDHRFQFEFAIPQSAPQSIPPINDNTTNYSYLIYRLKATINKGKCLARGNITTIKGIWVEHDLDIARDYQNLKPVVVEEMLNPTFSSGKIYCKATLSTGGTLKGELVSVTVDVDNQSTGDITGVTGHIVFTGRVRDADRRICLSRSNNVRGIKATEGPVMAKTQATYQLELPWDFEGCSADGNLMPVGTVERSQCKIIEGKYEVEVEIKRKALNKNITLKVPIQVGNINTDQVGSVELYPKLKLHDQ